MWECPHCRTPFIPDSANIEDSPEGMILTCPNCDNVFGDWEGRFVDFNVYDDLKGHYDTLVGLLESCRNTIIDIYQKNDDQMFRARLSGSGIFIMLERIKHELNKRR